MTFLPTKSDINFERRKNVALFINECIKDEYNEHDRLNYGIEIIRSFGDLMKIELKCRSVGWCTTISDSSGTTLDFEANDTRYVINFTYQTEAVKMRWIDFMFIHHIPFSTLKNVFIIANGNVYAYRDCLVRTTRYN